MTDTRGWYHIAAYDEDRTAAVFGVCANCGSLIIPGMHFQRRKYRFGYGTPSHGNEYKGAISWKKFHHDCEQPWWQVSEARIARSVGRLKLSKVFLANRKRNMRPSQIAITVISEDVGQLVWVPAPKIQEGYQKNGPVTSQNAQDAAEAVLGLLVHKLTQAHGDPKKAERLSHALNMLAEA